MKRRSIHEWIVSGSISESIVKQRGYIELVRCEDCRYWDRETIRQNSNDAGWWNEAVCLNLEKREKGWDDFDRYTDAEWYCADGKRRGEEDEGNRTS